MMMTERMQANLLTIDQLESDDALDLIHEAQAFKAGKQVQLLKPAYAINMFFLKIQPGPKRVFKWLKKIRHASTGF